jgi:exodeoxyribonuclease VII large subunit
VEQFEIAPGAAPAGPALPGPFAVGRYARVLRDELRKRARVLLIGEVTGLRHTAKQSYFEVRDAEGAVPCTIWADELAKLNLPDGGLRDGAEVVIAGGPDYFPGTAVSSPGFSFRVIHLRLAGEGDLLARLVALRKQLHGEGLFELQKQLRRPLLPKVIGVVTAETGAARRDLVAGLRRRGWEGTVVWAFAPVQDRRAAPAITTAIQDLAARPEVEAIVVTRGGGSLADLWAFCDETLCRTVAMLRVPVVSAVGHERDTTLIDDVAAVACSTPTHAAEAAVPLDCLLAREGLQRSAGRLRRAGEGAVGARARHLGALARGPARALQRERGELNQKIREIRAASERGLGERLGFQRRIATVVLERARQRGLESSLAAAAEERQRGTAIERSASRSLQRRREILRKAVLTLRAHDPERTLERGYALAETAAGEPVTSASAARAADEIILRFADGRVAVRPARGGRGSE